MGLLTTPPEGAGEEIPDTDSHEEGAQAPAEPAAPERVEAVPLPDKPLSTRERARQEREAVANRLASLEKTTAERESNWQRQMNDYQQTISRLSGNIEAMTRGQQQQQAQQRGPDPDALMREARKSLETGDMDEYHRKMGDAFQARVIGEAQYMMEQRLAQVQAQQQPQIPPMIQAMIAQHPHVAAAGDRGIQVAILKDQELALTMNMPPGPERYKRAFELANNMLGGPQQQQFSASGRGALNGVPASRNSGNHKQGQSIKPPSGDWKAWARRAEMSEEEYLREYANAHPEAIE